MTSAVFAYVDDVMRTYAGEWRHIAYVRIFRILLRIFRILLRILRIMARLGPMAR
jgi:hypothetical protein